MDDLKEELAILQETCDKIDKGSYANADTSFETMEQVAIIQINDILNLLIDKLNTQGILPLEEPKPKEKKNEQEN